MQPSGPPVYPLRRLSTSPLGNTRREYFDSAVGKNYYVANMRIYKMLVIPRGRKAPERQCLVINVRRRFSKLALPPRGAEWNGPE